jgi:vancomycin resistance protein VanJ
MSDNDPKLRHDGEPTVPGNALPPSTRAGRPRVTQFLTWLAILHGLGTIGLLALLLTADRWWLGTVWMFAPRWLWAVPLAVLIPGAAWLRPRLLLWLGVDAVLVFGGLLSVCVPWRNFVSDLPAEPRFRIMTFNVHWSPVKANLNQLLAELKPDLVALQGCNSDFKEQMLPVVGGAGDGSWTWWQSGQLIVGSRFRFFPVTEPALDALAPKAAIAHVQVETPSEVIQLFNVHLATPRAGLRGVLDDRGNPSSGMEANTTLRNQQLAALHFVMRSVEGPFLIAGDFNTPPESALYREYCSEWRNAFSASGWGWGHSFRSRYFSVRIDHLFAGPGWRWVRCWLGPDIGSPHRPLIGDVVRVTGDE